MILAVMNAIYAIAYIEAWKSQDFNGVWTRDLAIPVRRSNQLSYEATDTPVSRGHGFKPRDHGLLDFKIRSSIYETFHISLHIHSSRAH